MEETLAFVFDVICYGMVCLVFCGTFLVLICAVLCTVKLKIVVLYSLADGKW